jgi:hypothetical protein
VTVHAHSWGPVRHGRFSGEPHRPCLTCSVITLDLYLYCELCGEPISDPDDRGEYHHIDPETRAVLALWDSDHAPVPEAGEAPYDEDESDDSFSTGRN